MTAEAQVLGEKIMALLDEHAEKNNVTTNDVLNAMLSGVVTIAITSIGTEDAVRDRFHEIFDRMWTDALESLKRHSS